MTSATTKRKMEMTETDENIEWLQSLALARNEICKEAIAYIKALDIGARKDQTDTLARLREAVRKLGAW